jgi:hypothetical protein
MSGTYTSISTEDAARQGIYALGEDGYWAKGKAVSPYQAYLQATTANMPDVVEMHEIRNEIVIDDDKHTDFENLHERIVNALTYTRTLNNTWNALYVPFEIELTKELLDNYDVAYINDVRSYDKDDNGELDDWDIEIIKYKKLGKLQANHPYVIRPKNDTAVNLKITQYDEVLYGTTADKHKVVTCSSAYVEYAIKGIYTHTANADLDKGNYVFAINKEGHWEKMSQDTSLEPFRLYLTLANKDGSPLNGSEITAQSISMRLVGEESDDTVIYYIETNEEDKAARIYDLQGRRVLEPQKGGLYIVNGVKVVIK